jgi:hypothetical protein
LAVALPHQLTIRLETKAQIQFSVLFLQKVAVPAPINQATVAMGDQVVVPEHRQAHPHRLAELQHQVKETMVATVQLLVRLLLPQAVAVLAPLVNQLLILLLVEMVETDLHRQSPAHP